MRKFTIATSAGRAVEISEFAPVGPVVGTVLFSHGAASAPQFYGPVIWPLVAAGWRILAPLHVDSRLHPDTAKFAGLASWQARLEDMAALTAHIGHKPYVAMGHSYGGLTALVMGGAQSVAPKGWSGPQSDGKAKAVIALSPPPAIPVLITREGYGKLSVPALVQTGTLDVMPGMKIDGWQAHLDAYEAAQAGGHRYGLVLSDVSHYFGGLICDPQQKGPLATKGMEDANRVLGLFIAAYGRGDGRALALLDKQVGGDLPVRLMRK
ncbi:alpha/beta fold hydrolase [Novosphingobium umbonatum]|uniref:Alpha/beta fold hydrolase n=2 Tax=Novosphingobium umbonatum TaxID=1908524 RepID=A0A437NBB1_9SPHN|nr:alpha/beta fold hydrolase [Novosphingobium umbonatum]